MLVFLVTLALSATSVLLGACGALLEDIVRERKLSAWWLVGGIVVLIVLGTALMAGLWWMMLGWPYWE